MEDIYEPQRQGVVISKENPNSFKRHVLEDYSYDKYEQSRKGEGYNSKLNERGGNPRRISKDLLEKYD